MSHPADVRIDLGVGHLGAFVWGEGVDRNYGLPSGVVERHGDHAIYLPWAGDETGGDNRWTLDSLYPLTLIEPIMCPRCGIVGRIDRGRWVT